MDAEKPVQINLANFSVVTMAAPAQNDQPPPRPSRPPPPKMGAHAPPSRPPPPTSKKGGFLRRPIPIVPTTDAAASIYTITPARQSIADFNLALKKPEHIFVQKHRPDGGRRIWLRRCLIAGGTLLLLTIGLIVILEITLSRGGDEGANRKSQ